MPHFGGNFTPNPAGKVGSAALTVWILRDIFRGTAHPTDSLFFLQRRETPSARAFRGKLNSGTDVSETLTTSAFQKHRRDSIKSPVKSNLSLYVN